MIGPCHYQQPASVGATVVCHTYRRVGYHFDMYVSKVRRSGEKKSDEEENLIQVDVIISPPSLGAPPNYFSSEAVTVASQLHLGRPTSAKRAVCMDGSHLLNRAPRRFDRGRLKVSVPAQFQRNSRSEGPGPRRGKSSLCQCALPKKKADTDYPRSRGTHAPGVWSCICDSFRRSLGKSVGSQRSSSSRTGGCPTRRTHAPDARHWHAGGGQRTYMRAHEDGSESQSRFLPEKTKTAREPSEPCCAEH